MKIQKIIKIAKLTFLFSLWIAFALASLIFGSISKAMDVNSFSEMALIGIEYKWIIIFSFVLVKAGYKPGKMHGLEIFGLCLMIAAFIFMYIGMYTTNVLMTDIALFSICYLGASFMTYIAGRVLGDHTKPKEQKMIVRAI